MMNLGQYKEKFEPILKNMKEIDDFQKIESIALYEHQIVIVLALKHEKEKLEPKFEDPNLQCLLNEIKKLQKRLDDVEHLLFYQKAIAISGSTISNFFLVYSEFTENSRNQNDNWIDYFSKLQTNDKIKKLETMSFGVAELKKLAKLVNENNLYSYPKVKEDKVKSLINVFKNQKCNLTI